MIKVFIPELKRKNGKKELARGFWKNEAGRVYYDYISVKNWSLSIADNSGLNSFKNYLEVLKVGYKQEAIFYINNNIGNCYYSKDKIEVLGYKIVQDMFYVRESGHLIYNMVYVNQLKEGLESKTDFSEDARSVGELT